MTIYNNHHKFTIVINNHFEYSTRYFAVLKPLNFEHRGKIMIGIAWIMSTICSMPQVN